MTVATDHVPNGVFRVRFQMLERREGLTLAELATRLGWMRGENDNYRPDTARVARALGLIYEKSGPKRGYTTSTTRMRTHVTYAMAVRLADALELDPYEAGI